ncbi:MAG: M56 family metallopeptidase [Candidatus Acidiferrum sp.]
MNAPIWFSNLMFWSLQVALLVLAAGLLPRLLRIRQPGVLLMYWRVVLAAALILPFVQPWHRAQSISSITIEPEIPVSAIPVSSPVLTHWHFPGMPVIAPTIGLIILAGIALRFVMLAFGLLKLRQFRQASSPIHSSVESIAVLEEMRALVKTSAEFRISADVDSPVTFGLAAPVILLPKGFSFMDARCQVAIACHELLHVRRRDWAQHLAEEIIRGALWFHPGMAWLIARARLAREQVVDLEVVRLTNARKPYLEALLEFATGRANTAAIPAPPFLVERQLAERVALMLEEVRMSRTRLIASLAASSFCIVMTATLAVWAFPLKAAPRALQNPPQTGVAGGVSGGVTGGGSKDISGGVSGGVSSGVTGGVSGGLSGGVGGSVSSDIPTVDKTTIWTDTVKRGPMLRQVRGLGTIVPAEDSAGLVARIALPVVQTVDVKPNQNATIDTRKGLVKGHVTGINASSSDGTRTVYVSFDGPLPEGVGTGLPIDAIIDIEKLDNILYVGRPVAAAANSTVSLFKLAKDGAEAERVNVKLGRSSVNAIEVLDGLKAGDKIILSDMSTYDNADRIRIK